MDDFISLLEEIPYNYSTTNQVYGIAYFLYLGTNGYNIEEEFLLDLVLSRLGPVPDNEKYYCIAEYGSLKNYFVSHHYNFALNLMSYVGISEYLNRHPDTERRDKLEQALSKISDFLNYEKDKIQGIAKKTVAFELIVGTFIDFVKGFGDKGFIDKYKSLKKERLRKFSPTIVFTPEGIDTKLQSIFANYIAGDGLSKHIEGVFVLNSAQASVKYAHKLEKDSANSRKDFEQYIYNYKGTPPFFKAEIFDCFWMIDIAASAGLLDNKSVIDKLVKLVSDLDLFNPKITGCFDRVKGFSIAKGFGLYDSDTTSLGIKTLSLLGVGTDQIYSYKFDYYKNQSNGTYYSFKNDNRPSVTTMAHILDAMVATGQDLSELKKCVDEMISNKNFVDKWHTSELYSLYILIVAYTNMLTKLGTGEEQLALLIDAMCTYQDKTGGFSSNKELSNTLEESCWAYLALTYLDRNNELFRDKYRQTFERLSNYLYPRINDATIENLEKLWVVKEIYHQSRVTRALIQAVKTIL